MKKCFISYQARQVAWAAWLAEALELSGWEVEYQAADSRAGQDFRLWYSDALRSSNLAIALLSPSYEASEHCQTEWSQADHNRMNEGLQLLPIRVVDYKPSARFSILAYISANDMDRDTLWRALEGDLKARNLGGLSGPRPQRPYPGFRSQTAPVLSRAGGFVTLRVGDDVLSCPCPPFADLPPRSRQEWTSAGEALGRSMSPELLSELGRLANQASATLLLIDDEPHSIVPLSWLHVDGAPLQRHRGLSVCHAGTRLAKGEAGGAGPLQILALLMVPFEDEAGVDRSTRAYDAKYYALACFERMKRAHVHVLQLPDPRDRLLALSRAKWHAAYVAVEAERTSDGTLVWWVGDENGTARSVTPGELASLLAAGPNRPPRLVLLAIHGEPPTLDELQEAVPSGTSLVAAFDPGDESARSLLRSWLGILDDGYADPISAWRQVHSDLEVPTSARLIASGPAPLLYDPTLQSLKAPDLPAPPDLRLSVHRTRFVGRWVELRDLRRIMTQERAVLLWGPGGVGKTQLGRELVEWWHGRGDRLAIGLSGHDITAGAVLRSVYEVLAEHPAAVPNALRRATIEGLTDARISMQDRLRSLDRVLHLVPIVLLLDNFEDAQRGTPDPVRLSLPIADSDLEKVVSLWIHPNGKGALVITGRYGIDLPRPLGDRLFAYHLSPLGEADVQHLVRNLVESPTGPSGLAALAPADRERLVRQFVGHPRAIEMLDLALQGRPPEELLSRARQGSVDEEARSGALGPQAVQRVLDAMEQNLALPVLTASLDAGAREVLSALCVFRGPFTLCGAYHVTVDEEAVRALHSMPDEALRARYEQDREWFHQPFPLESTAPIERQLSVLVAMTLLSFVTPPPGAEGAQWFVIHPWVRRIAERLEPTADQRGGTPHGPLMHERARSYWFWRLRSTEYPSLGRRRIEEDEHRYHTWRAGHLDQAVGLADARISSGLLEVEPGAGRALAREVLNELEAQNLSNVYQWFHWRLTELASEAVDSPATVRSDVLALVPRWASLDTASRGYLHMAAARVLVAAQALDDARGSLEHAEREFISEYRAAPSGSAEEARALAALGWTNLYRTGLVEQEASRKAASPELAALASARDVPRRWDYEGAGGDKGPDWRERCVELVKAARSQFTQAKDLRGQAQANRQLAYLYRQAGNFADADQCYLAVISSSPEEDELAVAEVVLDRADLFVEHGFDAPAEEWMTWAAPLVRGRRPDLEVRIANLAVRIAFANERASEALALIDAQDAPGATPLGMDAGAQRVVTLLVLGRFDEALASGEELAAVRPWDDVVVAIADEVLGYVHQKAGRLELALEHCFRAIHVFARTGRGRANGSMRVLASVLHVFGDLDRSTRWEDWAITVSARICAPIDYSAALIEVASRALDRGNFVLAARALAQADEAVPPEAKHRVEVSLACLRAAALAATGDPHGALQLLEGLAGATSQSPAARPAELSPLTRAEILVQRVGSASAAGDTVRLQRALEELDGLGFTSVELELCRLQCSGPHRGADPSILARATAKLERAEALGWVWVGADAALWAARLCLGLEGQPADVAAARQFVGRARRLLPSESGTLGWRLACAEALVARREAGGPPFDAIGAALDAWEELHASAAAAGWAWRPVDIDGTATSSSPDHSLLLQNLPPGPQTDLLRARVAVLRGDVTLATGLLGDLILARGRLEAEGRWVRGRSDNLQLSVSTRLADLAHAAEAFDAMGDEARAGACHRARGKLLAASGEWAGALDAFISSLHEDPTMPFDMRGVQLDIPSEWRDQGMITFTLPSPDPWVRPNLILTKERLTEATNLEDYFDRIVRSVTDRIGSVEILSRHEHTLSDGAAAKVLLCRWKLDDMGQGGALQPRLAGKYVAQYQMTSFVGDVAINLTGSCPDEHRDTFFGMFERVARSVRFGRSA